MKPKRIQMQRVKGWRKPEGAIVVARPSRWGNPIKVGDRCEVQCWGWDDGATYPTVDIDITPEIAVAVYRRDLLLRLEKPEADAHPGDVADWEELVAALEALRGHDLACWCPLTDKDGKPVPCHADILLALANS